MEKDKTSCIFCKIILVKEASSKVFEDDNMIAFMSLRPINQGEVLIIPKEHVDHFYDLTNDTASKIILLAQKLSRKIKEKLNPTRVGYVVHGFGVPHAHFAIIPLNNRDDISSKRFMKIEDGDIEIDFDQVPIQTRDELDRVAEMLRLN